VYRGTVGTPGTLCQITTIHKNTYIYQSGSYKNHRRVFINKKHQKRSFFASKTPQKVWFSTHFSIKIAQNCCFSSKKTVKNMVFRQKNLHLM